MRRPASAKVWLAALLIKHAASRLRRKHPEWATAMVSEIEAPMTEDERLRWSAGCAVASYRAPGALDGVSYPAALTAGIVLMAAYQWSADESLQTVAVLGLIGLALGALQPRKFWVSGAAIGLVVAAVNTFETITGVRPAYETYQHTVLHDVRWAVLVAPALIASGLGGYVGAKLRSASAAPA